MNANVKNERERERECEREQWTLKWMAIVGFRSSVYFIYDMYRDFECHSCSKANLMNSLLLIASVDYISL